MSTSPPDAPRPVDPLATGCTQEELAQIEASKKKAAEQPEAKPLRWGPLDKAASIALGYVREADAAGSQRLADASARELAAQKKRHHDLIEAVVGRRPPLVEGHDLSWSTGEDGKTYLVAVPRERA